MLFEDDPSMKVKPLGIAVYAALLAHRNRRTGQCNPKQETLEAALGISGKTLRAGIANLIDTGWIERKAGRYRNNYVLHDVPTVKEKVTREKLPSENIGHSVDSPASLGRNSRLTREILPSHNNVLNSSIELSNRNSIEELSKERSKPKPKSRKKPDPNPDLQPVIDFFCEMYLEKVGEKYPFAGGKDAKLLSELLKRNGSEGVKARIVGYLSRWRSLWPHSVPGNEELPSVSVLSTQFEKIKPRAREADSATSNGDLTNEQIAAIL